MRCPAKVIAALAGSLLELVSLGCEKKLSVDPLAAYEDAQAAARSANSRVAVLEQQLAEIYSGKNQPPQGDRATAHQVWKSEAKALQRQLLEARESAEWKRKVAMDLPKNSRLVHPSSRAEVVDVPEGTPFSVQLGRELTTSNVAPGDSWNGILTEDVVIMGRTIWRAGSEVQGVVTQSLPAGRLRSGRGSLGIKMTYLGQEDIDSTAYVVVGDNRGARNANCIGGGPALGALVGLLSDPPDQGDRALGGVADGVTDGPPTAATLAKTVIKLSANKSIPFSLASPEKITLRP